ncbi:hypothetical protein TNCV_3321631 [Trichonephila clavipes]|nr:hypothetical protein TNCV_3321631 [Trichonephila clavipes]
MINFNCAHDSPGAFGKDFLASDSYIQGLRGIIAIRGESISVLAPQKPNPLLTWRTDAGRRCEIIVFLLLGISLSLTPNQRRPVRLGRPYQ